MATDSCNYHEGLQGCEVRYCGFYLKNAIYSTIGIRDFGVSVGDGKVMMGVGVKFSEDGNGALSDVEHGPGSDPIGIITTERYDDGEWHEIVATRDQSTGEYWLIVDGTEVGGRQRASHHGCTSISTREPPRGRLVGVRPTRDLSPRLRTPLRTPTRFLRRFVSEETTTWAAFSQETCAAIPATRLRPCDNEKVLSRSFLSPGRRNLRFHNLPLGQALAMS
jgi:hypothetical protein